MPVEIGYSAGWMPDLSENIGGHLLRATNVIPSESGYRPFRQFQTVTDALPGGTPLGGIAIRDDAGVARFFVATADDIFLNAGSAWTNVSPSAGFFTTPSTEVFDATRYGIGTVFTNFNDPIHTRVEGVDTNYRALIDITSDLNYLDGNRNGNVDPNDTNFFAPRARWVAEVANHLVIGYTNDNQSGVSPERVAWSRLGDPSVFVPNAEFLSNFNDLRGGGAVQRIVRSGEYGVVFQEETVSRMDAGNPDQGFDITAVDQARGALMPGGVIPHGRLVGYIAEDGFHIFDGNGSEPIGVGRVDRTFLRQYDNTNSRLVRGAVDPVNKAFIWALPLASANGQVTRLFMWSWAFNRWSEAEVSVNLPIAAEVGGTTADGAPFGSLIADTVTDTIDSARFAAQQLQLGAFTLDNRFSFPTGQALAATLETSDLQLIPDKRSIVTRTRPRFDGNNTDTTVSVGVSQTPNRNTVFGPAVPVNKNGECPTKINGRYHRFRQTTIFNHQITEFNGLEIPDDAIQPVGDR